MAPAPDTFATKADAARWLATVEVDQARGVWVDPRAGEVPLGDYAYEWLDGKVEISRRTREIYETQIRLHILPAASEGCTALGALLLTELTPERVRRWYGELTKERGRSVAAKAYTRLRQILAQAVDDDRIGRNPCRIKKGGAERHREQGFVSLEELYVLAAAAPDRYRALVLLAGLCGLRQGELFALRRRDVNLLDGTINVCRKRLRLASGEVIEDEPKTDAGRRSVTSPDPVTREMERHLAAFVEPSGDAYVFTSATGQPLERSNFRQRVWVPTTSAAGYAGLRFHDLRHTAGTLAARTGATTKELMARLGHASPQAAMVYQHAADDRDRRIADGLAAMTAEAGLASVTSIAPAARSPRSSQFQSEPLSGGSGDGRKSSISST